MKSKPQATKVQSAKIEAMKKIKAAYSKAKTEGTINSFQVKPV